MHRITPCAAKVEASLSALANLVFAYLLLDAERDDLEVVLPAQALGHALPLSSIISIVVIDLIRQR